MILISSEPRRAYQKPATANPSMKEAAKKNSAAFITSANKPRVSKVIGNVRMTKIGFRTALNNPKITAAITAVLKPSTVMPGTNSAIRSSPSAFQRIRRIIVISNIVPFTEKGATG
jgi:hypothetical protein